MSSIVRQVLSIGRSASLRTGLLRTNLRTVLLTGLRMYHNAGYVEPNFSFLPEHEKKEAIKKWEAEMLAHYLKHFKPYTGKNDCPKQCPCGYKCHWGVNCLIRCGCRKCTADFVIAHSQK